MARILVIDDNLIVASSLQRLLEDHIVELETDAPTAVARLTSHEHFDVILCDVRMPRMNGLEVLHAVIALQERPIFILITGDEDAVIGARGVDGILMKPFDGNELRGLIQSILELRARATTRRLRPVTAASSTTTRD